MCRDVLGAAGEGGAGGVRREPLDWTLVTQLDDEDESWPFK